MRERWRLLTRAEPNDAPTSMWCLLERAAPPEDTSCFHINDASCSFIAYRQCLQPQGMGAPVPHSWRRQWSLATPLVWFVDHKPNQWRGKAPLPSPAMGYWGTHAPSTSNCLIFLVTPEPHKLWNRSLCGCLPMQVKFFFLIIIIIIIIIKYM